MIADIFMPYSSLEKRRDYHIRYREQHREYFRSASKKWRESNRERHSEYCKEWWRNNHDKWRESKLVKKYGITLEDYNRLVAEQKGVCFICGEPPVNGDSLCVDHDHATGEVRGLLCRKHNLALGVIEKNLANNKKYFEYLGRTKPFQTNDTHPLGKTQGTGDRV